MSRRKFHEYLYDLENWVDEFAIAFLSFGTIVVLIWTIFYGAQEVNMMSLGRIMEPWITMLALMVIARELWMMNLHNRKQAAEGE